MTTFRAAVLASLLFALAPGRLPAQVDRGAALIRSRHFQEAQRVYTRVLNDTTPKDSVERARALFGRSFAAHQIRGTDSAPATPTAELVRDYLEARRLDSAGFYAAASNNAALLLRDAGRHPEAATLFLDASRVATVEKPLFLFNAARELESLRTPDSAAALYRAALAARPDYAEARSALLDVYVQQDNADSLLAVAGRWRDPASLQPVHDAILLMLTTTGGRSAARRGDPLLLAAVRDLAELSPALDYFREAYRPRYEAVATALPALGPAVASLLDAYAPRKPGSRYRAAEDARWWKGDRSPVGRWAAWSSVLRSIGDQYLPGDETLAASYYEAALGYGETDGVEPWVDLRALLPLATIYGHRTTAGDIERLDRYVNWLFIGKGAAYAAGDLFRIRTFHMTLGEIFYRQQRWGTPGDIRGALFQLEHMRMMTRKIAMEFPSERPFDPPLLLEHLARAYAGAGDTTSARAVTRVAAEGYGRVGLLADQQRLETWADSLASP